MYKRTSFLLKRFIRKLKPTCWILSTGMHYPNKTFYENGCYVTRAMAQTLLAQVYLQWAGAPLNGGADYYGKAAQMALNVINDSPHGLIHPNGTTDD